MQIETDFNDRWRPRIENAKDRVQKSEDFLLKVNEVASSMKIRIDNCTTNDVDSDTLSTYRKLEVISKLYRDDYNSENTNRSELKNTYESQNESSARIMAYTAYVSSDLRVKLYSIVFDAISADLADASNFEHIVCAVNRIASSSNNNSIRQLSRDTLNLIGAERDVLDLDDQAYEV